MLERGENREACNISIAALQSRKIDMYMCVYAYNLTYK